jgi:hypothetical protein
VIRLTNGETPDYSLGVDNKGFTNPFRKSILSVDVLPLALIGSPRRAMLRTKLDLRSRGVSITKFEGSRLRLATDAGLMEKVT